MYHSYLQPIITYARKTWSLTKGESRRLMTSERKVPTEKNIRSKIQPRICNLMKEGKIKKYRSYIINQILYLSYIKSRLEWFGHVWRADVQVIKEV